MNLTGMSGAIETRRFQLRSPAASAGTASTPVRAATSIARRAGPRRPRQGRRQTSPVFVAEDTASPPADRRPGSFDHEVSLFSRLFSTHVYPPPDSVTRHPNREFAMTFDQGIGVVAGPSRRCGILVAVVGEAAETVPEFERLAGPRFAGRNHRRRLRGCRREPELERSSEARPPFEAPAMWAILGRRRAESSAGLALHPRRASRTTEAAASRRLRSSFGDLGGADRENVGSAARPGDSPASRWICSCSRIEVAAGQFVQNDEIDVQAGVTPSTGALGDFATKSNWSGSETLRSRIVRSPLMPNRHRPLCPCRFWRIACSDPRNAGSGRAVRRPSAGISGPVLPRVADGAG